MILKTAHVLRETVDDFDMGPTETAANYGLAVMEDSEGDGYIFFGPAEKVDDFVKKFGDDVRKTEETDLETLMGY